MEFQPLVLLAAALLLGGVLMSKTSSRLGVPSLVLFLALGMLAGSEGVLGIEFDDAELARSFGVIALAFILFSGGLSTHWRDIAPVLAPGIALATIGVAITAVIVGLGGGWLLGLDPLEGLLLGGIIASTDAAAVFAIMRSRGVSVGPRLRAMVEFESGSNDPMAVFLTVAIIGLIEADGAGIAGLFVDFGVQLVVGAIAGYAVARGAVFLLNRLRLEFDGLYPVFTFAFVLLLFEGVTWVGGSGFLACYVAGLVMADRDFLHKRSLIRFHDAIGWIMQIAGFVVLGLLVFPSQLLPVAWRALAVAALLMFLARPLAVFATLLPFRLPVREIGFVSWVGLRGAAPIILATFPIVAGLENASTIFNVVFFIVLTSVLLQGTSIPYAARLLKVASDDELRDSRPLDAVVTGDTGHGVREFRVAAGSAVAGCRVMDLGLPPEILILLVQRGPTSIMPQGSTVIEAGDEVLVFAADDRYQGVEAMFGA